MPPRRIDGVQHDGVGLLAVEERRQIVAGAEGKARERPAHGLHVAEAAGQGQAFRGHGAAAGMRQGIAHGGAAVAGSARARSRMMAAARLSARPMPKIM